MTGNNNCKLVGMSTDSAPNMVKSVELIGVERIPCVAHTIHNLVQKVITTSAVKKEGVEEPVRELHLNIEKMKAVVTYFKQYTTAKCALDDRRKKLHQKGLCLVQSICTRWNTEFYIYI